MEGIVALQRADVTYTLCAPKLLKVATPLNICFGTRPGILAPHNEVNAARATRRVCESIVLLQNESRDVSRQRVNRQRSD